jgi:hypothetical protein
MRPRWKMSGRTAENIGGVRDQVGEEEREAK